MLCVFETNKQMAPRYWLGKVDTFFSAKPNRTNDHHQWWWRRSLIQLKIICGVSCSANKHCVNCRHWIFPSNEKFQCLKIKTKQIQQQRQIGGCGLEFHSKQNKHSFQDGWILFPLKKFDQQLCEQKMGNFLWFFHFFSWSIFFSFSGFIVSGFLKKEFPTVLVFQREQITWTNKIPEQTKQTSKHLPKQQPEMKNFSIMFIIICVIRRMVKDDQITIRTGNIIFSINHIIVWLQWQKFHSSRMTRTRKWLESLMNLKVNEKLREKWQSFFSYNQWMNLANVFSCYMSETQYQW